MPDSPCCCESNPIEFRYAGSDPGRHGAGNSTASVVSGTRRWRVRAISPYLETGNVQALLTTWNLQGRAHCPVCAQVPALDEADCKSVQPNRVFLALQGWFHRVCRDGRTSWNAVSHFAGGRAKCDLNIKTCGMPDSSIQLVPSINFDHLKCRLETP